MEYSFVDFLNLLGSLALFLFGMKLMSEGIQKAAGEGFQKILSSMTRNRVFGVLTGFLITGLVQSSSATTVMTVSFVNAGLLTLTESAGIMMGANIGTTVTAWFLSILGFKVKLGAIAIPLMAVGVPMLFMKRSKIRFWGETIIGFALLFYGLTLLKESVPDIKSNPDMVSFVAEFTDLGYFSYLLFVLIGAILTVVIQSSSATMALTLVMTSQGWITFEIAAAMVLGENIGTTITAELASLAANVYAKRSAKIHTLFNVIGVSWMLLVFPFFLKGIAWLNGFDSALALDEKPEAIPIALSTFHTLFNLINVLILINFVPQLVNLATVVVKSKGKEDEEFRLEYIKSNMNMVSPQVSGLEARQEITRMALHVTKMMGQLENLMSEKDEVKRERIYKKLQKYEEISDKLSEAISDFLSKTSKMAQSNQASYDFMMMLGIAHDLENMADIFVSMGGAIMGKNKRKIWFSPDQRVQLDELLGLVRKALETMNTNLAKWDISPEDLEAAVKIEAQIDRMRKRLRKNYLSKIEEGEYNVRGGILYAELFNSSERLADYIENISQGLAGNL
jgi:phosphate:Na+ symporter